ncbi:helix-turn-helix domain-containing protein [Rhizobium oryziradicis]|uniref:Helix-turn-helix domain-containing protein n=1 Tax=Rhizobium oryziradicis TaxID=1867956 RepID=A0A1Q8ZRS9_9HYPH|nr:helix-turn-helix domain-containing protein [Rhizobium oryziradicis]OLP44632.1 hypothetical protein BJF95_09025 [Rhizobium oryziradicis]
MSAEATIRRGVRNARYTTVPNHVFEDDRLSMEARWLLGYLLSKPDNWTVVVGDIVKRGKCGRDKARKMIAELVEIGYAEREQTRDDGKFSASVLVIYDEPRDVVPVADPAASESVAFLPQTDLPATAKPSPVLPSPVKSAPSKDLKIVNTESLPSGEALADDLESAPASDVPEKGQGRVERERASRQFDVWFKAWPKPGSPVFARNAWFALSADDRAACIEKTPIYLAWAKPEELTAPAVYLKGRAWNDVPEHFSADQAPVRELAKPCGKLWMGTRLEALLGDPTGRLVITTYDERQLASGAISREALLRQKRRDNGWPLVSRMHELARHNEPFFAGLALKPLVVDFQKVERGTPLFVAWRRLHERRGWLFVDGLRDFNYFPPIEDGADDLDAAVEAALEHFRTKISKERTNDAA